ncbi:hypothetical protein Tco_1226810 [Tanacetum coccineum]
MRLDELYKFSDRTLTRLRTLLDDITKNIQMKYLPKRRWSTLEKKQANIMIKAIDKQLKERSQNQRDLPRDIPLDSVVVLRYEKRSKSENKGKVPTEMELVLEETQQGTSYEVSVSAEEVEELKRKFKIKSEKKEALLTLRQKLGIYKDGCGELQDKRILKAFKLSYQEKYEHVGPKSQDHKLARLQDDVKRLCLVDDLKKFKITFYQVKDTSRSLKVKDHYNISQVND